MATTTPVTRAHILIMTRCPSGHTGDVLAVYAERGEKPLDTFSRVLAAHEYGDALPDFIAARGYIEQG